ncbi:MAG: family ATPase [Bacteroidetes bacterium]|jgi:DNA helicase-2/ATP-dependent DNA helicase PcrA|nr:family ATPase [Bacteroidota bacterium]MDF2450768.1 family ATPase [Bacteroidota bacterium]
MSDYLNELNPVQRLAAETTEGPVMIIAGAGSGKTRVLTYRIAHIMEKGNDAFNILSLTFTNKAAREMKERIAKIVGSKEAKNIWMGTFHSIFAKILRFEAEKLGYPSNFTIYDTDDSKSVIKDILKQLNLDDKVYKPSLVLNRISSAKNSLISAHQYANNPITQAEDRASNKPLLGQVYLAYQKRNFKSGAMDFDDLLYNTNVLLRDFPDVLVKYQSKFKYILVDEYQDTNFSQYVIVKQLAARFQNICVVGDDAQSIYSFRGANIQNILNFEKDYPDLKTFKLEQNYRSTQTIVKAASAVIAINKDQFKKNIFTDNEEGEKIKIIKSNTDNEEGQKVAASIYETHFTQQAHYKDFAILYRTNAQSRSFEEAMRKLNIPYRIYGGVSFYQRKEIKDVLSYFRLSINHNDDESLKRIINYPTRGIGQTTIDKIMLAAMEHDISMWQVLDNLKDFNIGINSGTALKISEFTTMIKTFSMMIPYKDAFECANHIAVTSGIVKDLYHDKTPEGVSRYENIQELLNGIKDFVEQERTPQEEELKGAIFNNNTEANPVELFDSPEQTVELKTLDEFMQEITLLTDVDKESEDEKNSDKVSMMTIHASKGLEFPYVHIVGLEENLFPSQMALNSRSELEEERRLFYVAITRAEKKATISFATTRYRFGNIIYCEPSRFIDELDEDCVDFPREPERAKFSDDAFVRSTRPFQKPMESIDFRTKGSDFNKAEPKQINFSPPKKLIPLAKRMAATNTPSDNSANANLRIGSVVEHEKFGIGEITAIEGVYPEAKASIQFRNSGEKNLLLKYAKLKVVM